MLRVAVDRDDERQEPAPGDEGARAEPRLERARPLTPASVLSLQRTAGNRAVAGLVGSSGGRRRLQRGHTTFYGEEYEFEREGVEYEGTSVWAISDDLNASITVGGQLHVIPPAEIHQRPVAVPGKGNFLYGALTVVHREGQNRIKSTTTQLDLKLEPKKYEGFLTLHTEPTYFLMMLPAAVETLRLPSVLAVIIEIRQAKTPCATCQKVMSAAVANIESHVGKPIIVRGSAMALYESAPGKLGTALHEHGHGKQLEHETPANVSDVHGIHKLL